MKLSEAKVLITGGSSGIGRATARMLAAEGARVVICGRREAALHAAAEETGAIPVVADVSREDDVLRLVRSAVTQMDGLNVLINNAGFGHFAPLVETTAEQMREVWETNVLGAALVGREAARHFVAHGGGNIINVASTAGQRGFAGGTAYASSKFALAGMTECWRAELRPHDVRVVLVNPSEVQTDFAANAGRAAPVPNPTKLQAEDVAHTLVAVLRMHDRGFVPEVSVWATNPR